MEIKTDSKGDASNSAFTSADKMRFCSLTYEVIEELRLRRELAAENERKIEKLINDRFTMGWKLDQESGKVANLSERHEAELRETRRQLEEKMRDCQVEASQQQVYRKMAEKEKEALKDEIRRLQLANYSLEKRVRESEHQQKIQANEREQHIVQVSRFESLYSQVDGMVKQFTSKQEQLERDMKVVQNLSKSLQYENCHQKCVLNMKEADLVRLRQQLLDTQIKVKLDPNTVQEREDELQAEIRRLKNLVAKSEENYTSLETDMDSWKKKYWDSLKKLDESHRLLHVHLHNAARYRDECESVDKLLTTTQVKLEKTEHDLKESRVEMEDCLQKHEEDQEAWTTNRAQLNSEIQNFKCEVQNLSLEKDKMETSLSNADEIIGDIKKQLKDAWTILNVEKFHVECQTELQMLQMLSREVQANPSLQNQGTQVLVDTDTGVTQTIDAALRSTEVQTDFQGNETMEIQTNNFVTKSTEVQMECELTNVRDFKDALTQTQLKTMENESDLRKDLEIDQAVDSPQEKDSVMCSVRNEILKGREKENSSITVKQPDDSGTITLPLTETRAANLQERALCKEPNENLGSEDTIKAQFSSDIRQDFGRITLNKTNSMEDCETPVNNMKEVTQFSDKKTGKQSSDSYARDKPHIETTSSSATEDGVVKNFGLVIPKVDIEKSIDNACTVSVDPDEFSVELTQDDKMTDNVDLERAEQDISTCKEINHGYVSTQLEIGNEFPKPVVHGIAQLDESNDIDKAIEKNWEMSEEHVKVTKTRAKKHKLTKETVKDQFVSFDMDKEKFQTSIGKEEVQPKQPKLTEISSYRALPKKQRNYSSMFKIEEVVVISDESEEEVQLVRNTESQRSYTEEISYGVKREKPECPFLDINSQKSSTCQLTSVNKYKCHAQQKQIDSQINKECVIKSADGMKITGTSLSTTDSTSISPLVLIDKPIVQAAKINDPSEAEITSTTFKQEKMHSSKQKEQSQEDTLSSNSDISVANTEVPSKNNPAQFGNGVGSEKTSVVENTSVAALSVSGSVPTAAIVPKLQNPVLGGVSIGEPLTYPAQSGCLAPSSFAHHQAVSATDIMGTLMTSDQRKPKAESNADFLQKYRDIVAKIKPVQHSALHQAKGTQKTKRITDVTPRIISLPDISGKVSPRGGTPRGILKGASRKDRATRNVTWNEYVLNKDFLPNENTTTDN